MRINEYSNDLNLSTNDLASIRETLGNEYILKNFNVINLGWVDILPMTLYTPKKIDMCSPNMLVLGGFHGDEASGVLATLFTMLTLKNDSINISYIPLVNPSGYALNKRCNCYDEDPNRRFIHNEEGKKISMEGEVLFKNIDLIKKLGSNCILTLHENDRDSIYFYTYEPSTKPGSFSKTLSYLGQKHFPLCKKAWIHDQEKPVKVSNGIIYKPICDGTFEDRMYHEGIEYIATIELPQDQSIDIVINAGKDIINGVSELSWLFKKIGRNI